MLEINVKSYRMLTVIGEKRPLAKQNTVYKDAFVFQCIETYWLVAEGIRFL